MSISLKESLQNYTGRSVVGREKHIKYNKTTSYPRATLLPHNMDKHGHTTLKLV